VARVKKHTIIGNSAAGLSAIKAIRKSGDSRPIVLISAEKCNAYSPVLTTYYIGDEIKKSQLFLAGDGFYKKHQVQTIFGRRVETVDPDNRRIYLDDRSRLDYDDLLIASGASARDLDHVDPDASKYVSTLRTIADADKIKAVGEKAEKVVAIGAGLVSLQTIKAMLGKRLEMTLVVGSEQVLSQQMDRESAFIIQEKLAARGVDILFGREVTNVCCQGGRAQVVTSYGESLAADLVVVGKGVRPNTEMVKHTAIRTNYGILVDGRMRTNLEDIYAAGDVAEGRNEITGEMEVIATWFNACAQGEIAGFNMAGRPARRQGQFRENVTTLLGVVVASIGESKPEFGRYEELRHADFKHSELRKLYLDDSCIIGALLVGKAHDAGVIRHCIANRIDISPWKNRIATAPMDFGKILCNQGLKPWPSFSNEPNTT
jgi:NAD(P)H-nitrite reductase large subunit